MTLRDARRFPAADGKEKEKGKLELGNIRIRNELAERGKKRLDARQPQEIVQPEPDFQAIAERRKQARIRREEARKKLLGLAYRRNLADDDDSSS
jgi:hypothetical protein